MTFDEYAHVPSGYSYWKTGDFSLYSKNPPLVKLWFTLPLLISSPQLEYDVRQRDIHPWVVGFAFLRDNLQRYHSLFLQCRAMVIFMSALLGGLIFLWARALYGWRPGLLCLFFYTFCPNILAHSQLCTTDVGGAFFFIAALGGLWLYVRGPTPIRIFMCGVLIGAAQLAKFSNLILYVLCPATIFLYRRTGGIRRTFFDLAVMTFVSLCVINIGYIFEGTLRPLSTYSFMHPLYKDIQGLLPGFLPVPLPAPFVIGIDRQQHDVDMGYLSYLNGRLVHRHWWFYFLEAFSLKTPIPFLLLLVFRAVGKQSKVFSREGAGGGILLISSIAYFANFSFVTPLDIGIRYILPVYPLLSAWTSPVVFRAHTVVKKIIFTCLLGWLAASSLGIHPFYLSYFNEIAGGPEGGRRYLSDSNIDWGQDLPQLKKYMDSHGLRHISLFYYGVVDPEVYGISSVFPHGESPSALTGDIAVSVSFLQGNGIWAVPTLKGGYYSVKEGALLWLNKHTPVGRAGYSLYIFHL